MNTKFSVYRFMAIIAIASSTFVSCDDDISQVGSESLIGSEINTEQLEFEVRTGQLKINQPQTNNLVYNLLGSNDHGVENTTTTYNILAQINSVNPILQDSFSQIPDEDESGNSIKDEDGNDIILSETTITHELTDMTLVIPLRYNLLVEGDTNFDDEAEDNTSQYYIESNSLEGDLKLKIYQSQFNLIQNDPNDPSNPIQKYYGDGSDGEIGFNEFIRDELIIETSINLSGFQNPFTVNSLLDEQDLIGGELDPNEEGDEHTAEGLSDQFQAIRISLFGTPFAENLLENLSSEEDLNNNEQLGDDIDLSRITDTDVNFTETLLRGLHIDATDSSGIVEVLNSGETLVNAGIQLKFTRTTIFNDFDGDDDSETSVEQIITTLQFSNNPINIFETDNDETEINTPPVVEENTENIILQSGLGSIGILNLSLLDEDDPERDFTSLREEKALLNDAILELTVNRKILEEEDIDINDLPDNIFIAGFETGNVLLDYTVNNSINDEDNETLKENHLIPIRDIDEESEDLSSIFEDQDIIYRINITEHLAAIIGQDSDEDAIEQNIALALSVTEDISITSNSDLFNPNATELINQGSLLCFKTVPLHGSNSPDESKRPRLIVKYTETTN